MAFGNQIVSLVIVTDYVREQKPSQQSQRITNQTERGEFFSSLLIRFVRFFLDQPRAETQVDRPFQLRPAVVGAVDGAG